MRSTRVTNSNVSRTFTLEEANALIPRVVGAFGRTTQLVAAARQVASRLAAAGVRPAKPGELPDPETVAHDPALAADLSLATAMAEAAMDEVKALQAIGVEVRDIDRGLVNFRSVVDGQREVYLSWQLGEREIQFFHDLEAGFVGREPIEGHRFFRSRQLSAPRDS